MAEFELDCLGLGQVFLAMLDRAFEASMVPEFREAKLLGDYYQPL